MKTVLFGKNGQIGQELQRIFVNFDHLYAFDKQEANLQNFELLNNILCKYQPRVIINAAGYTLVDVAETDPPTAYTINANAVNVIAQYAKKSGALIIHYSTDFVFDGEKSSPYIESDFPNPLNVYGKSKLAGEEAILLSGCDAFIFRIGWVFSHYKKNFITQILNLAKTKPTLDVVNDQIGAPTSAQFVAQMTLKTLLHHEKNPLETGIYHLAPSGTVSRYDLARYIVHRAHNNHNLDLKLHEENIFPVSSDAYSSPARRPKNSRLNTEKLSRALNFSFPYWTEDVDRTLDEYIKVS